MSQKLIFTTSPWKDATTGKWMLSCFISMQLDDGSRKKLSSFPDIMNWITKINQADFFVQWDSNLPLPVEPKTAVWNPDLFAKLFHENINVKTFQPLDVSKLLIKSYPVKHISNFILNTYKDVGNLKIDELPKVKFFTKEFTALNDASRVQVKNFKPLTTERRQAGMDDFVEKGHVGKAAAMDSLKKNKAIGFSPVADPKMDFGQFFNFHTKLEKKKLDRIKSVAKPEFEFHDILSILTSYPVIMRKLGLILDFELSSPPPSTAGTVRILPSNLGMDSETVISSPATAYQYTGKGFYAAPKEGSFVNMGMLKINSNDFEVVQIDTDGAAMKLSNHTETISLNLGKKLVEKSNYIKPVNEFQRKKSAVIIPGALKPNATTAAAPEDDDDDDDAEEGLPSLRSAGIGILKNGLAQQMMLKLNRNLTIYKTFFQPSFVLNNQALSNVVKADSRAAQKPKAPLAAMQPNLFIRKPITAERLQNLRSVFEKRELIPVPTEILYADDILMGYRMDIAYEERPDEWFSLHKRKMTYAFAPVGKPVETVNLTPSEEIDEGCIQLSLTDDDDDDEDQKKLNEVIARWEGWSLAVPRIGKGINTEGKEVSSDDEEAEKYRLDKDSAFRLQVDTKPAPRTLPRLRFGKKYLLKIRTVDIAGNGLSHDVQPEDAASAIKRGIEYRRFEPLSSPIIHQADEVAGGDRKKMRDRDGESLLHMVIRSNDNVDAKTYEEQSVTTIVTDGRAQGTLKYIPEAVRFITAPRTSQYMAEVHGVFDDAIRNPERAKELYQFITSRDKETVNDGKTKASVIPVSTGQLDIDYLADPMAAGVVFTMKSETSFETPWKKGENKKFSFYFDEPVTDANANRSFTFDDWKNPRSIKIRLVEGDGAPFWKDRVFTIPLPKSAMVEVNYASFWRPDDLEKYAGLLPAIKKGSNALKADQQAKKGLHWMFSPWRTIKLVHAVQQPLEKPLLPAALVKVDRNFQESFAKIITVIKVHGASTDRVDVGAAWSEWVDELDQEAPRQITLKTQVASIPVLYNDNLIELFKTELTQNPKPDWLPPLTHHFNDTRFRKVRYSPSATSRFREYFTGIIDTARLKGEELTLSKQGDAVELIVPSSSRPNLPIVEYVLPSFTWAKDNQLPLLTHIRTGNIRVYVRRPWYSSGDDEMLAVLLPPKGVSIANNTRLQKYCTVWGMDPAFGGLPLNNSNFPTADYFTGAAAYDTVGLSEEDLQIGVAAYKVFYDKEKQLHYADIPVQTGLAYYPFVKLSLARYQKHSVRKNGKDCCLSSRIEAEWIQVVPTRSVSVRMAGNKYSFELNFKGVSPFRSNVQGSDYVRIKLQMTVEPHNLAKTDDLFIAVKNSRGADPSFTKEFYITQEQIKNGQIEFSENISIPAGFNTKLPFRIVIREFEMHETDPMRNMAKAVSLLAGNASSNELNHSGRMVFMDVFEIN